MADYLELGAAATARPDLDTVSQLLRASSAGAQVVDALLRVLESDRGDKTPVTGRSILGATPPTVPATSMLKDKPPARPAASPEDEELPTPPPTLSDQRSRSERHDARAPAERRDEDKTQRKPYPRQEGSKGGE